MKSKFWLGAIALAAFVWTGTASAQIATEPPRPDTLKIADGWHTKVKVGLGLAQSYYTQNWAGSEVGTVAWLSAVDALAAKQVSEHFKLENTLVLAFGQTHQQDRENSTWLKPIKSTDKVDFDAIGRFTFGGFVDPYVAFTLDSQFYSERPSFGRKYLNPMLLGEFAGVARAFRDTDNLSLVSRLGFGVRQRVERFHGTDPSVLKRVTNDGGFEFRTLGRFADSKKRTEFKTDLYLYQAVYFSESELDSANRWKQVDIRWQNTLDNKLYSSLTVSLYLDFVYDAQIKRAGQLKQTLGVGLTYEL